MQNNNGENSGCMQLFLSFAVLFGIFFIIIQIGISSDKSAARRTPPKITTKTTKVETTTEITTVDYELLKYDVLDDIDNCETNIRTYLDELVSAADSGSTGYYRVANDILKNTTIICPEHKYKEYGGTYYELVDTLYTQLIKAANSIVKMYDNPDKQVKYQVDMEDSLSALKYGITLIENTRLQWLKDCGWFTEEEIGWVTSE